MLGTGSDQSEKMPGGNSEERPPGGCGFVEPAGSSRHGVTLSDRIVRKGAVFDQNDEMRTFLRACAGTILP